MKIRAFEMSCRHPPAAVQFNRSSKLRREEGTETFTLSDHDTREAMFNRSTRGPIEANVTLRFQFDESVFRVEAVMPIARLKPRCQRWSIFI